MGIQEYRIKFLCGSFPRNQFMCGSSSIVSFDDLIVNNIVDKNGFLGVIFHRNATNYQGIAPSKVAYVW